MRSNYKEILADNQDKVIELWTKEMISFKNNEYESVISSKLFEKTNKEFANIIFKNLKEERSMEDFKAFTENIISFRWPLSYITHGLQDFRRVSLNFILNQLREPDTEQITDLIKSVDSWIDPIIQNLVDEYSGSWEQVLTLQRVALQELSAPLIPVTGNITIMPLIGAIDTSRARLIIENLLTGVIKHSSEVVLIDITGVPVVDTMVAHHIIQAVEAVRLIGSTCILVGIRPEIAQTIVSLGIDLNKIPTQSSLRKGFAEALKIMNKEIVNYSTKERALNEMINSIPRR